MAGVVTLQSSSQSSYPLPCSGPSLTRPLLLQSVGPLHALPPLGPRGPCDTVRGTPILQCHLGHTIDQRHDLWSEPQEQKKPGQTLSVFPGGSRLLQVAQVTDTTQGRALTVALTQGYVHMDEGLSRVPNSDKQSTHSNTSLSGPSLPAS